MIMPYFVESFWGEKNSGFDVLYHNMKHGQISTKEVSDFIRERATIEETYARSMTKLAKSASNYSQLGTFAPVWDVFKTSTEKLASCHLELVRKLQELIKEVQKYGEEQIKAHKKTKEEVASTLEAVQNIQSITQTLQKSKENYNAKSVEQERLKKEGATQKELEKAGLKTKKATESYKSYVEKYAVAKTDFEQKMSETAQKFQDIEEGHVLQMKEIIQSYSQSIEETHLQIGQVHNEFVNNMENTTVESLLQKCAETKGTGKERPGPIDFEECNIANATEGAKPRKRKTFGIPGRRKEKDTDSVESPDAESLKTSNGAPTGYYGRIDLQNANIPEVDDEGFCLKPEVNENEAKENNFYSSSDSEDDDEPRKFHVEIKPVQPNNGDHQASASIDELKASIVNITLSPSASVSKPFNSFIMCAVTEEQSCKDYSVTLGEDLVKSRLQASYNNESRRVNSDLLSLDPLFGPPLESSSSSSSLSTSSTAVPTLSQSFPTSVQTKDSAVCSSIATADLMLHNENSSLSSSPNASAWGVVGECFLGRQPDSGHKSPPSEHSKCPGQSTAVTMTAAPESMDILSSLSWSQSQWISFTDELMSYRHFNASPKEPQRLQSKSKANSPSSSSSSSSVKCISNHLSELCSDLAHSTTLFIEENIRMSSSSPAPVDINLAPVLNPKHNVSQPARPTTPQITAVSQPARPTTPLTTAAIVPPPRPTSRPKLSAGKLGGINEIARPFSPAKITNASPPPTAPLARAESTSSISSSTSLTATSNPAVGISRGPSPVSLGSLDSLPIAAAFTESVNAYFKGADPSKCIVKITGDMTVSFPTGIIKIFTSNPSPPVLSFKLKNTSKLEQILPNQQLLYSDPSQSDSNTQDFWMNMQALTACLRKMSEQNPSASYYNVDILKYQVASNGIQSTPLNLATYWKCSPTTTDVRVDYRYNPESMLTPGILANVQVLVPVDGGVTNMQSLPTAVWNAEQKKALWKLKDISEKSENAGSGSMRAKFELSEGPTKPATLAVQFLSEGSTLSGVEIELVGSGYRLSLTKKRFATGRYMADC
ncbi:F-BAR domain only protein 2-like isoform X4 [Acipenser oxyrinchus oxyrinchus]|uniref:F-BAR domain only protein 2 n=1 Tax=Acipenser oxyrinchus oxyrinchus TaxID=40147 RepID=A0AAD8GH74_ACIOX|nr:F-BAR domain only protein 2-like isoform X4 [Acipenser oxyrinchus oxyrinchus]